MSDITPEPGAATPSANPTPRVSDTTSPSDPAPQAPPANGQDAQSQEEGKPLPQGSEPGTAPAAPPPGEQGDDGAEKKAKSRYQERIDELTAARREAERRAAHAEARAADLAKQLTPPGPDASLEEQDEYRLKKVVREDRIDQLREEGRVASQEAARATFAQFQAKAEAAADRMPGLVDKFCALPDVTPAMAAFVAESEKGAEVAHYLAEHANEATRLARLSPLQQGVELARLEGRLSAAPLSRKTSTAPPPPPTLAGAPSAAIKSPGEMSVAEIQKVIYGKGR